PSTQQKFDLFNKAAGLSSVANHLRAKHGVLLRGISKPSGSCLRFYYRFNKLPHFKNIINL
ncbi:hypothetical protein ACNHSJ_004811, partial [Escherichia coli]